MEKIDAKILGMVSVTLLTRLTAHLERSGALPLGWTAEQLREAAQAADRNVTHGTDPALHEAFAAALRRVAEMSIQPPQPPAPESKDPVWEAPRPQPAGNTTP